MLTLTVGAFVASWASRPQRKEGTHNCVCWKKQWLTTAGLAQDSSSYLITIWSAFGTHTHTNWARSNRHLSSRVRPKQQLCRKKRQNFVTKKTQGKCYVEVELAVKDWNTISHQAKWISHKVIELNLTKLHVKLTLVLLSSSGDAGMLWWKIAFFFALQSVLIWSYQQSHNLNYDCSNTTPTVSWHYTQHITFPDTQLLHSFRNLDFLSLLKYRVFVYLKFQAGALECLQLLAKCTVFGKTHPKRWAPCPNKSRTADPWEKNKEDEEVTVEVRRAVFARRDAGLSTSTPTPATEPLAK